MWESHIPNASLHPSFLDYHVTMAMDLVTLHKIIFNLRDEKKLKIKMFKV